MNPFFSSRNSATICAKNVSQSEAVMRRKMWRQILPPERNTITRSRASSGSSSGLLSCRGTSCGLETLFTSSTRHLSFPNLRCLRLGATAGFAVGPARLKHQSPEVLARPACLRCGSARSGMMQLHQETFLRHHFFEHAAEVDRLAAENKLRFEHQLIVAELQSDFLAVRHKNLWRLIAVQKTDFQKWRGRREASAIPVIR